MKNPKQWLDGYNAFYKAQTKKKKITSGKDHYKAQLAYIRLIQKNAKGEK